jgi:uracil-DNA glycosylase
VNASDRRSLDELLVSVRDCRACEGALPLGPRPVLRVAASARLLIVGQAPGARVRASGVPWDDASGARLREWMGIEPDCFYDASAVAVMPMGFCYPGRGKSGDLPPRRECAVLWHPALLARLPRIELTLLVGLHAQRHFLRDRRKRSLTETTRSWREFAPAYLPLPHPSARNTPWFKANPWFERELLPVLRARVASILASDAAPRR